MKKPYAWPYLPRSYAAPPRLKIFLAIASWSCSSPRASSIAASVAASATPVAFSGGWAAWNSRTAPVVIGP